MGWIKYDDGGNGTGWYDPSTITLAPTVVIRESNTTDSLAKEDVIPYIFQSLRNFASNGKKMGKSGYISNDAVQIVVEEVLNYIDSGEFASNFFSRGMRGTIPYLAEAQEGYYKIALIEAQKKVAARNAEAKAVQPDYEAEYNAKFGVVLREKSHEWYMENVYPLSIGDWAAQQLGYALPNAEDVDAISF